MDVWPQGVPGTTQAEAVSFPAIATQALFSTKISSFVSGCFYLHVHKELPRNVEPSQVLVITTIKLL